MFDRIYKFDLLCSVGFCYCTGVQGFDDSGLGLGFHYPALLQPPPSATPQVINIPQVMPVYTSRNFSCWGWFRVYGAKGSFKASIVYCTDACDNKNGSWSPRTSRMGAGLALRATQHFPDPHRALHNRSRAKFPIILRKAHRPPRTSSGSLDHRRPNKHIPKMRRKDGVLTQGILTEHMNYGNLLGLSNSKL